MFVLDSLLEDSATSPILIGQFTKISRKSSEVGNFDTPQKKRRERAILTSFGQEVTPRSAEKIAHNLGRKRQWVLQQQKRLVSTDQLVKKNPKLLSSFLKVKGKNNRVLKNVQKGCEYACGGKTELITCSSCQRFVYHVECLEPMCRLRNIQHQTWKPNGNVLIASFIFIIKLSCKL